MATSIWNNVIAVLPRVFHLDKNTIPCRMFRPNHTNTFRKLSHIDVTFLPLFYQFRWLFTPFDYPYIKKINLYWLSYIISLMSICIYIMHVQDKVKLTIKTICRFRRLGSPRRKREKLNLKMKIAIIRNCLALHCKIQKTTI